MRKNSADLHLTISKELKDRLEKEAIKRGINLSSVVRLFLTESLTKE